MKVMLFIYFGFSNGREHKLRITYPSYVLCNIVTFHFNKSFQYMIFLSYNTKKSL